MQNRKKKIIKFLTSSILFVFIGVIGFDYYTKEVSKKQIYTDKAKIKKSQVALVLGARVYASGQMSPMFSDRAKSALDLYQAGVVEKILVSGDHGRKNYDEVNSAKDFFLENNVPASDIFLDHAGFDTYDSLYRAKAVFGIDSLIIVTQDFHLPRALFIANSLNLDAQGFSADRQAYANISYNYRREKLSKIKALLNVILKSKPKYLGKKIDITKDGQATWDKK